MLFDKYHQPQPWRRRGGRKPSPEKIAKREKFWEDVCDLIEKEKAQKRQDERKAFDEFLNADSGIFDGFEFPTLFHDNFSYHDAIDIQFADENGDVKTYNGIYGGIRAGKKVYFLSEKPTKRVDFNRSVYFI